MASMTSRHLSVANSDLSELSEESELFTANLNLFDSEEYADLIVQCDGQIWYCHRAILCQRCEALKDEITGDGPEWKLKIEDATPGAVALFLLYLYTLEPPDFRLELEREGTTIESQRSSIWGLAAQVCHLSSEVKFNLPQLYRVSYGALLQHAPRLVRHWDRLGENLRQERLETIKHVWSGAGTPKLKKAILRGMTGVSDQLAVYPGMHELLCEHQGFMLEYVHALSKKAAKKRRRQLSPGDNATMPIDVE